MNKTENGGWGYCLVLVKIIKREIEDSGRVSDTRRVALSLVSVPVSYTHLTLPTKRIV